MTEPLKNKDKEHFCTPYKHEGYETCEYYWVKTEKLKSAVEFYKRYKQGDLKAHANIKREFPRFWKEYIRLSKMYTEKYTPGIWKDWLFDKAFEDVI